MAEETFMFAVTAGVFVFLVAILFGSRARRYRQGYTPPSEAPSEHS
jgi:thiosulfate reductase cytochrome b subunit